MKVDVFNINVGHNMELLETCRTLGEYAEYVHRIRHYTRKMGIEDAVERTIKECIQEGILREFLEKNRAEAKAMSIYEYNEEEHIRMEREDAFADGQAQERLNTEREYRRAEQEKARADAAEEELRRLKEKIRSR